MTGFSLVLAGTLCAGIAAAPAAEPLGPLLSPEALAGLDGAGDLRLVDLRAPDAYAEGHLAGAVNVPYPAWRGPQENPGQLIDEARLTENLQALGARPDSRVVVLYQGEDATDFGAAARVYWTIKSAGIDDVAILNGGVDAWTGAGHDLTTEEVPAEPSDAAFSFTDRWLATEEEVEAVVGGEGDAMLVDARPDAFFRGETQHPAAKWAGTLADAVNITFTNWFAPEDPVFRGDPEDVRARARDTGWTPGTTIVSFCNTGHWAAINWFALSEIAGIEDVKLYPESMVGWTLSHES
ncbi:MAG TPA: rhodanese-like domain-containing protein [Thermohalobaculum sp.]|nr:rhodanese-like domain-containing protein [Thermohalobaculum sp.]